MSSRRAPMVRFRCASATRRSWTVAPWRSSGFCQLWVRFAPGWRNTWKVPARMHRDVTPDVRGSRTLPVRWRPEQAGSMLLSALADTGSEATNAVQHHAEVDAPPEVVFAVLSDVERWPEWTPTVTRVERLGNAGAPLALGGRLRIVQPKVPPAEWTVTAFEPPQRPAPCARNGRAQTPSEERARGT